jgi:hypothetical protein
MMPLDLRLDAHILSDFVDWHPGGRSVLLENAVGRDATGLFNTMHSEPAGVLLSIEHLSVGKVVEHHKGGLLGSNEVMINDYIYRLGDASPAPYSPGLSCACKICSVY